MAIVPAVDPTGPTPVPRPLPLGPDELAAWLRLANAPAVRPAALRRLLDVFGLPCRVLGQSFASLAAASDAATARAVLAPVDDAFARRLAEVQAWCARPGQHLLPLGDPAYPPSLLTMPDPPPLLYVRGGLQHLLTQGVAVVGSRSATPQGCEDAYRFARALASAGLTVVSGLARGIDGAAHLGALAGNGGTIAVVGTGADVVYPAAHARLADSIAAHGAILSEWPLGTPARPAHFPQRNRLIAGLTRGVLVVEAAMRSGSLITARLANEMGRDVFAVPGSIHAPLSRGCHRLIREGAQLVETPEDILLELGIAPPASSPASAGRKQGTHTMDEAADPQIRAVLAALGHAPATLETLATRTDIDEARLQAILLELELGGHLNALPGGRYQRAHHAG